MKKLILFTAGLWLLSQSITPYRALCQEASSKHGIIQDPSKQVASDNVLFTQQSNSASTLELSARTERIEEKIEDQKAYAEDTRHLLNILIGVQFAVLVGFLTLAGWIEHKAKTTVGLIESKFATARNSLDEYMCKESEQFKDKIEGITQTLLKATGSQDLLLCGKVLYWTGEYQKALEPLNTALEIDPGDLDSKKLRGLCLNRLRVEDTMDQAITDLEEVLCSDKFKNDAELHLELARSCIFAQEYHKALKHSELAQLNGHIGEEVPLTIAEAYKGLRRFKEAIRAYDAIIEKNPRATPAILGKGAILYRLGRYDSLINMYLEAINQHEDVGRYHIFLAVAYAERSNSSDDWNAALREFNKAEEVWKSDWDLWYFKGRAYLSKWLTTDKANKNKSDYLKNAEECFAKGESVSKKASAPRFINQLSRLHLLSGNIDEAIRQGKRSVDYNPGYIQNHLTLCTALLAGKKWPEAIEAINGGLCHVRNNPGKIWCFYFNILTHALQRHGIESLKNLIGTIVEIIEISPYFDPSGWDWSTTQQIIAEEVDRLSDDVKSMIKDLDKLMLNEIEARTFRLKWLKP